VPHFSQNRSRSSGEEYSDLMYAINLSMKPILPAGNVSVNTCRTFT
jgi:hypothetical protein